ncbi:MAG: polyphosphate kinase 1, partial [Microthrixaceae bacterium]
MSDDAAQRYLNRELSWLDFNARVLALAQDPATPLLERVKFLAIFSQNLDEFFQVRVAGLKERVAAGVTRRSVDGRTASEQLEEILARARELCALADEEFLGPICAGLAEVGIRFSSWSQLDEDDREWLTDEFHRRIFPVLTPLAVDPGHPFPYISTLSLNLGVIVADPTTGERRFARVKVPSLLPRFVVMPDGERFVPLEQVIAAHLDQLFPGMDAIDSVAFRVTRNADLTVEDEDADDLLAAIEMELRRRRFGKAVRLEVEDDISAEALELIRDELELTDDDVFAHAAPVDLGGLFAVHDVERPELKYPDFVPVTQRRLSYDDDDESERDIFGRIAAGDILMHHPYDSFVSSVEEFIRQAANDPKVLTIKLTLYRTSGDSPIVASLIRAAEQGKQVAALVELKARFDEERNIEWARRLEQAGVHVVYGLVGLKTHTKTCLVVRDEGDGVRRYCHIGTGNYNSKTARLYEDIGLLTVEPRIGADLSQLFNYLTGYARDVEYQKLLVAPHSLRPGLTELIRRERRAPAGTG